MERYSVLVTGANRGIGLELVKQLSQSPVPPRFIFASYRSCGKLQALKDIKSASTTCTIELIKMDVQIAEDVTEARKIIEKVVGEKGITLLINNAGFLLREPFPNVTEENLMKHFSVNTISPIRVLQEMLPLLKKAAAYNASISGLNTAKAAVLNLSSIAGCITDSGPEYTSSITAPGYKISKAALNMAMRVFAANIKDDGILIVNMCPGWVRTDMGGDRAELTLEESISAMLKTLEKLDASHHGSFMDRLGNLYSF